MAGGYEDDADDKTDLVYTGQGGNNLLGNKRQNDDQKLERGNLALLNNAVYGVPVRVIKKNGEKGFIYDGLWDVLQMIKASWCFPNLNAGLCVSRKLGMEGILSISIN